MLSTLWSKTIWLDRRMLWLLVLFNGPGTIYGYMWYGGQIEYTLQHMPTWLVLFVPDSPTASLFFTLAVGLLLWDAYSGRVRCIGHRAGRVIRGIIEALAVITSIKYGIWAVLMIWFGYMQGDPLVWEEWMLIVSHTGMAVEGIIYARFFTYRLRHVAAAAAWTLTNDIIDYRMGVYPSLPEVLDDDIPWIRKLTVTLSWLSIGCAVFVLPFRKQSKV